VIQELNFLLRFTIIFIIITEHGVSLHDSIQWNLTGKLRGGLNEIKVTEMLQCGGKFSVGQKDSRAVD